MLYLWGQSKVSGYLVSDHTGSGSSTRMRFYQVSVIRFSYLHSNNETLFYRISSESSLAPDQPLHRVVHNAGTPRALQHWVKTTEIWTSVEVLVHSAVLSLWLQKNSEWTDHHQQWLNYYLACFYKSDWLSSRVPQIYSKAFSAINPA